MLEVTVNVNREQILAQVHAVRIKPKTKRVKDGTICTYKIMFNNEQVDTMTGAYGCGIDLAIEMLKRFDKTRYMMLYMAKAEESMAASLGVPAPMIGKNK